jgi:tetratricopeptide (TPR) repeat protein
LANLVVQRLPSAQSLDLLHFARIILLAPDAAERYASAVPRGADVNYRERDWPEWCRAMTALRLGQPEKALPLLDHVVDPLQELPVKALVLHHLGRRAAAAEALAQSDQLVEKRLREGLGLEKLKIPDKWWADWLAVRVLRREAHLAIHGKPLPDSPYERLFRGRVFHALEMHDPSATEFAAAVAQRPEDAEVWLTRSRIYARLGRNDRMAADLLQAQKLKGDDPNTWIAAGRMLAERGEHQQADAAFARAAVLGKGELSRFLEAGWWVVGPYPDRIDRACPPEVKPDPSRPVAAVDRAGNLKWQPVSTNAVPGNINFRDVTSDAKTGAYYALAYVYADRDRTAGLYLRTGSDLRVWVNGKLVLDGFAAWSLAGVQGNWTPVTLRKGRNEILVKTLASNPWNEVQFEDAPPRRAISLMEHTLWAEAADAWAEADRREQLEPYRVYHRVWCLLAIGRNDEARRVFEEAVVRNEGNQNDAALSHLSFASPLPPAKGPDRDRWVEVFDRLLAKGDTDPLTLFSQVHAYYRAARFEEADKALRKLGKVADQPWHLPLRAMIFHQLGNQDEARKTLETGAVAVIRAFMRRKRPMLFGHSVNSPLSAVWTFATVA